MTLDKTEFLEKLSTIQLLILDVDGVLTDGSLFMGDDGQEYKAFNSKDGHGLRMLQESGIKVAIITGRSSQVVDKRAKDLGIELIYQGRREKGPAFDELLNDTQLLPEHIAYVGDDVVDLPVMVRCGLAISVQDAHSYVKQHSHWVCNNGGGRGAVREVCELILEANNILDETLTNHLK